MSIFGELPEDDVVDVDEPAMALPIINRSEAIVHGTNFLSFMKSNKAFDKNDLIVMQRFLDTAAFTSKQTKMTDFVYRIITDYD